LRDAAPFYPNSSKIWLRLPDHNQRFQKLLGTASLRPPFPQLPFAPCCASLPAFLRDLRFPGFLESLRFPGAPESFGFPSLSPEPRSPGSSLKFVFRLPGVTGRPAPPEIRRVPCSAGYPMLPEPAPGSPGSRLPGIPERRPGVPKCRLPSASSVPAPSPFPLRFPEASRFSVPSVMLFRSPGSS
jgi:hypothetical protein